MNGLQATLTTINSVLWHDSVLRGVYDDPGDPGAINHFQALSTALSATVGPGHPPPTLEDLISGRDLR